MVANQAFHGALEDGAYLDAHFLCGLGKYLLIMECYGADEMYLAMLIIVLHDVPFQESLETVQHQRAHTRLGPDSERGMETGLPGSGSGMVYDIHGR